MRQIPKSFESREQALEWIDTLSLSESREILATLLMEKNTDKVLVTIEQLQSFFKIRGLRPTSEGFIVENRGKFSVGRGGRKEELDM